MIRTSAALVALCLAGCATGQSPARIAVDSTQRFQIITGWEATAQAGQEFTEYGAFRDRLLDQVVDSLGLNRLRVEIRSGTEHTRDYYVESRAGRLARNAFRCARYETLNDDDDPWHITWSGFRFTELDRTIEAVALPVRARLLDRGERLYVNVNYVAFIGQCPPGASYVHADPAEYAEFVLATVLHLREKYGLVPDAWEVILEPDHNRVWSGRFIGEAMVAAAARLREHGIAMRFIAPSNTNTARAVRYFDEMAAVPGALALLEEFSYHRYGGVSIPVLAAIGQRARRHGVRTSMLEHIGADVEELEQDLTLAQVSAWQEYIITYPGDSTGPATGGHYIAVTRAPDHTLRVGLAPRARLLAQYFRHVRQGAQRIGATSSADGAHPVAFVHPDGRWTVVVRTEGPMALEIAGVPTGAYAVSWATADTTAGPIPVRAGTDGTLRVTMPVRGVLTVFSDRPASPPGAP